MSLSCYVYYRVRPDRVNQAETQVRAVMSDIGAQWQVSARLSRKLGEPLLWMEVYEGIVGDPAAFVAALDTLAVACGLLHTMPDGERRHVEVFECA